MKKLNVRDKLQYIDNLDKLDNHSVHKEIPMLKILSKDKNSEVRRTLAEQLALFEDEEIEEILCTLLMDKNREVRLEAVDALSVGRSNKSISMVSKMLQGEGYLIRMYAVMTLFDLHVNAYGSNETSFERYREAIRVSYSAETNSSVLMAYHRNEYYMNQEKGLEVLGECYRKVLDAEDYRLIWLSLHIFKEVRSQINKEKISEILQYKVGQLLCTQKEFVSEMIINSEPWKVLIIDHDCTFLSIVVSLLLRSRFSKNEFIFDATGINTGVVQTDAIKAFCERNEIECTKNVISRKVTDAHMYDYIICLNTGINQNWFNAKKALYFEDIEEREDLDIIGLGKNIASYLRSVDFYN